MLMPALFLLATANDFIVIKLENDSKRVKKLNGRIVVLLCVAKKVVLWCLWDAVYSK